jgi:hypothetical protein
MQKSEPAQNWFGCQSAPAESQFENTGARNVHQESRPCPASVVRGGMGEGGQSHTSRTHHVSGNDNLDLKSYNLDLVFFKYFRDQEITHPTSVAGTRLVEGRVGRMDAQ